MMDPKGFYPKNPCPPYGKTANPSPFQRQNTESRSGSQWTVRSITVDFVCNRWRDGGAWWSGESDREYIKLATDTGLLCVIAKDVDDGERWVMVRVYD